MPVPEGDGAGLVLAPGYACVREIGGDERQQHSSSNCINNNGALIATKTTISTWTREPRSTTNNRLDQRCVRARAHHDTQIKWRRREGFKFDSRRGG